MNLNLNYFKNGAATYNVIDDDSVSISLSGAHGFVIPDTAKYTGHIPPIEFKVVSVDKLSNCSGITIPASFTSIGEISNCSGIIIPSSVTSIGTLRAALGTLALTVPSSVMSISEIIGGIDGIVVLRMESCTPPFLARFEKHDRKPWQLIVPRGASGVYKKDPFWGKFKTIREDASLGQDNNSGIHDSSGNTEKTKGIVGQLAEVIKQQNEERIKGVFSRLFGKK